MRPGLVLLVALLASSAAHAEGKRRIAVFEYRQGSRGAPEVGNRLAAELARSTTYDVVDPTEGRRILGPSFDADIAKCAGAPGCVAQLATRLEADEALLIGVSQLGDLVLALQRVDTRKGHAIARLAESLPADKAPDAADLADWLHQLFPADAFRRYGNIRIVSDLDDAQVSINGQRSGMTPLEHALKVAAPGSYRVRVDKSGFLPFQARIEVPPDATVEVRATLSRRVGPTPWYKRWYVWATIGGAIAAAGAGVAIYYGTRVDQTPHGFIVPPR